ncbi:MAG: hypothetical protein FWE37_00715 [Spirochaetaceae bacterium]|nr:hypothetical protein [Spirochaetaceae bacterium]
MCRILKRKVQYSRLPPLKEGKNKAKVLARHENILHDVLTDGTNLLDSEAEHF